MLKDNRRSEIMSSLTLTFIGVRELNGAVTTSLRIRPFRINIVADKHEEINIGSSHE